MAVVTLSLACTAWAQNNPESADPFEGEASLGRAELIRTVLERNPRLEMARAAWQAALERVPQVSSLDDPRLSTMIAPLTIDNARIGSTLQASQMIPFPGKLKLRGEIARAEAAASAADLEAVRLELATMTSMLYDEWFVSARSLEINAHHRALLSDFKQSAEAQYVVGRAAQQDPLQAEVQIARLARAEMSLESQRDTLRAQINALLHRDPDAALPPPPAQLDLPPTPATTSHALQQSALLNRPSLLAAEARIRGGEASVKEASLDIYPDFELMAQYSSMFMGEHQYMAGIGITLPVHRESKRAAVREAEARLQVEESRRQAEIDQVRSEVDQAWRQIRKDRQIIGIYDDHLVPAARDQVEAARSGFETGANSFVALIDAENNLREVSLDREIALADLYTHRAQLDRAVGVLPELSSNGGMQ